MEHGDLAEMYARHGPLVFRRCFRLLGSADGARDATQEVFVRALRHVRALETDGCLHWLYRVATNLCLNLIRDGARYVPEEGAEPEDLLCSERSERWLQAREQVLALLGGLDEVSLQIVIMTYMDGLSGDEIARVLGVSRRTVVKKLTLIRSRVGLGEECEA